MAETKVRQNQIESVGFAQMASEFISNGSLGPNGYQRFPGGLIIQWGVFTLPPSSTSLSVTYPIPFPTAQIGVVALRRSSTAAVSADNIAIDNTLLTAFTARPQTSDTLNRAFTWVALGY